MFMRTAGGNALFLILIAVALFAALSYAVTQSGRGGGSTQRENDMLLAAQLAQMSAGLSQNLMRFNLTGVAYSRMKFHTGTNGACGAAYQLCHSGADCPFAPEGGGITLPKPPAGAFVASDNGVALPNQPATLWTTNMWIDCNEDQIDWGIGTSAPERVFYFLNVRQDLCRAYNRSLGMTGIPGADTGVSTTGNETSHCYLQDTGVNAGKYEIFTILYAE